MNTLLRIGSRINALPLVNRLSPAAAQADHDTLIGFRRAQLLARSGAIEIASLLQEGWTEKRAAQLLDTYLLDHGVQQFFHRSFVWFGDRCRFRDVASYRGYQPSNRVLVPNESVILDVAPIVNGFACDIGYSMVFGRHSNTESGMVFLRNLREEIPEIFSRALSGAEVWEEINRRILTSGFDNIHATYPFGVLGHRLHQGTDLGPRFQVFNFGWQSYWGFLSRGLLGQLLNSHHEGELKGLWAIEPHIGGSDWGAKFEEILVVTEDSAFWLDPNPCFGDPFNDPLS